MISSRIGSRSRVLALGVAVATSGLGTLGAGCVLGPAQPRTMPAGAEKKAAIAPRERERDTLLDRQSQELSRWVKAKRTPAGILVRLKNDRLFDFSSAVLKEEAIDQLESLGEILSRYPENRILIESHTDQSGSEKYNRSLSNRRAMAVEQILSHNGVRTEQIEVAGLGEEQPLSENSSAQGRATNRRIELHIEMSS